MTMNRLAKRLERIAEELIEDKANHWHVWYEDYFSDEEDRELEELFSFYAPISTASDELEKMFEKEYKKQYGKDIVGKVKYDWKNHGTCEVTDKRGIDGVVLTLELDNSY